MLAELSRQPPREQVFETDGRVIDRLTNPGALSTLGLLGTMYYGFNVKGNPCAQQELIAVRNGGVPPRTTIDQLIILKSLGLVDAAGEGQYRVTALGQVELSLNRIMDPQKVNGQIDLALKSLINQPPSLPQEAYAYEEFRFTWDSVADLLRKIYSENAYRRINLAVLGCPLVGLFVSRCPGIANNVTVMDINPALVDSINEERGRNGDKIIAMQYDALQKLPPTLEERFDVLVMDPPWHIEHYFRFADVAWEALRPFGHVYMSTFSPDTRPEAREELGKMVNGFIRGGFYLDQKVPQFFGYQIPDFERRVNNAQGIQVSSRGKYGELVVLEKQPERSEPCLTEDLRVKLAGETPFCLRLMDGRFINLYCGETPPGSVLTIDPFNSGHVYETTSRSARRKEGVNLITEGHIAYKVSDPEKLRQCYVYWIKKTPIDQIADTTLDLSDIQNAYAFFAQLSGD